LPTDYCGKADRRITMDKKAILSGIKVLDLGQYIAGPYAAKLLADNGADVIKIEPPVDGDISRKCGPFPNDIPNREASGLFLTLNTSKKGITLDITTEKGKELLLRLVSKADAVIENFKPKFLPALGLGYNAMSKVNPRLVVTSISNFGQSGPQRDWEATEIIFQATGGIMLLTGDPERSPLKIGIPLAQYISGLTAFTSTLAAIYHAQNTGEGQQVDVAIYEAISAIINERSLAWAMDYPEKPLWGRTGDHRGPLFGIYQCEDGFIGCSINNFSEVKRLAEIISPDLDNEEKFGDYFWGYCSHADELEAILVPWFFEHKKKEIMELAQGKNLAFSYVATTKEVVEDNIQLKKRGTLVELEHPIAGGHPYFIPCNRFSKAGYRMFPAPLLGQHNEEIFSNWLGLTKGDLQKLASDGVI